MKIFVYTEYNELFIRQINEEREKSILKFFFPDFMHNFNWKYLL